MLSSTALSARARRHLASRSHSPPPSPRLSQSTLSSRRAAVLCSANDLSRCRPALTRTAASVFVHYVAFSSFLLFDSPSLVFLSFIHPSSHTHVHRHLSLSLLSLLSLFHLQNTSSAYAHLFCVRGVAQLSTDAWARVDRLTRSSLDRYRIEFVYI